jgi:hypothetical protein
MPKRGKIGQTSTKLPNGHKMYQMVVIFSKWPKNAPTFYIPRLSKIVIIGLKIYHLATLIMTVVIGV